jgi:hypothetical protein
MENGEILVNQHVVRFYALSTRSARHIEPPAVKEATPCEKQKLFSKTFAQEVFSILHMWRRRMEFSIFREWAICLSRRACHVPII